MTEWLSQPVPLYLVLCLAVMLICEVLRTR